MTTTRVYVVHGKAFEDRAEAYADRDALRAEGYGDAVVEEYDVPEGGDVADAVTAVGPAPAPAPAREAERSIVVWYSSIDMYGRTKRRKFKTLKGASKYARHWVGDYPEFGSSYAVSADGIGRITVEGATLAELFPEKS